MADWKNRIVGYDEVEPEQLLANPANYRRHPRSQQDAMIAVLGDIGWVQEVIVNRTTGHVLDGHMRVELAMRADEKVPIKYVELTEEEERKALATFDPLGGLAFIDREAFAGLSGDLEFNDDALQALQDMMLFDGQNAPASGGDIGGGDEEMPGNSDHDYEGEDDQSFWPSIAFRAPFEIHKEWNERLNAAGVDAHEYLAALMQLDAANDT